MQNGIIISIDGNHYKTLPSIAKSFAEPPAMPERNPPVRFRKNIPTSWLSLSLIEGKNRQVRKMTAKVGFPTLRLIRYRIGNLRLNNLLPADIEECSQQDMYRSLFK